MIEGYLKTIEHFLAAYGALAVFSLGLAEELTFFIPMSLLFVAAGFFLVDPELKFWSALGISLFKIGLPAMIGIIIGGLVVYGIIYWGGKRLIRKFGAYVGLQWESIEQLNKKFKAGRIDEAVLVLLRVIPIFPIGIISIFCGFVRLSLWEFIWTTGIGSIIRVAGLSLLGWYLGREYIKYAAYVTAVEKYLVFGFLVVVLGFLIYAYKKQKKS